MSKAEWIELVRRMRAEWPHASVPDESIATWYEHVADLDAGAAADAIASLARDGREFPPTGGMIRRRVDEMGRADLDHGAAYALAMQAATRHGGHATGLDWLREQDPVAALAAERYGWREFCLSPADDTTRRAQFRDVYRGALRDRERADSHRDLEAGAEPRKLGAVLPGLIGDGNG